MYRREAEAHDGQGAGFARLAFAAALAALLIAPALMAWLCYRALRLVAEGIVLLILWAIG